MMRPVAAATQIQGYTKTQHDPPNQSWDIIGRHGNRVVLNSPLGGDASISTPTRLYPPHPHQSAPVLPAPMLGGDKSGFICEKSHPTDSRDHGCLHHFGIFYILQRLLQKLLSINYNQKLIFMNYNQKLIFINYNKKLLYINYNKNLISINYNKNLISITYNQKLLLINYNQKLLFINCNKNLLYINYNKKLLSINYNKNLLSINYNKKLLYINYNKKLLYINYNQNLPRSRYHWTLVQKHNLAAR